MCLVLSEIVKQADCQAALQRVIYQWRRGHDRNDHDDDNNLTYKGHSAI